MKKITLFLLTLFTCWQVNAQVSGYGFSQSAGTFTPITGGTVLATPSADDAQYSVVLPTAFTFNGTSFTDVRVSSNGFITFGTTNPGTTNYTPISSTTAYSGSVSAYGRDLNSVGAGSETRWEQVGDEIIFQWLNVRRYNIAGEQANFQIRLNTLNNEIKVVYGDVVAGSNTTYPQVGLRGAFNADYNNRTTVAGTGDWINSTAGANNTETCYINSATPTTIPSNGLTYTWTAPSCIAPGGFIASAITSSTATIAWNAANPVPSTGYEYYYSDVNTPPAGAGTQISGLTDDLIELTENTLYYVWLRSDCGGTFSGWNGPFTFRTLCASFSVPFSEGFNSTSTTESCWTVLNVNADADAWNMNYATNPFEGDQSAMMYTDINAGANNDWLISPTITLTGNQRLKFHYRVQSATEPNDFELLLSTTGNAPASFTNTLIATASYSNITYVEQIVDLSAYSGDVNIAWHIPNGGLDGWRLYIDNVIVEDIPSCVEPNTIIASNITSSTVDLSWTDGSGGLQFDYEYVIQAPGTGEPTGAGAQVGDITVVGEGFDFNGDPLAPNTLYEVYVRANCDGIDFSTWVGPITFRTTCANFVAPWTYDVETAATTTNSSIADCWTSNPTNTTSAFRWDVDGMGSTPSTGTGPSGAYSGTKYFYTEASSGAAGAIAYLTPISIDVTTLTTPYLEFYYHMFGGDMGTLEVEVYDGAVWTSIWSLTGQQQTAETDPWIAAGIDMSAHAVSNVLTFRFKATRGADYEGDMSLDNISVIEAPACIAPTNLQLVSVGIDEATFSWNAGNSETEWEYVIQSQGTGVPVGAGISTSNNPLTVTTGLASNTAYEIYIRAYCNLTDQSTWLGPLNFRTNIEVICGTPLNTVYCYDDNDTTTWTFTSNDGSPLRITFNAGEIEDCCDDILIYDGTDNTGTLLYQGNNGGDLAGLTFDSISDSLFFEIDSDGSVSCGDASFTTQWDFTVACATCVNPTATFTTVPDCVNGEYSVDVDVTNLGSATSVSISDGTTTLTNIIATGIQSFGPYTSGSPVTIVLTNEQDGACTLSSGAITYNCPAANDDLCDAIPVTVNAVSTGTAFNNVGATAESNEPSGTCFNNGIDGSVWFSFVAPASGEVNITTDIAGASLIDTEIAVYDATGVSCSDLSTLGAALGCDQDSGTTVNFNSLLNLAGLTVGNTYYIQVDMWGGTTNGAFGLEVTEVLGSDSFDNNNFSAYPNPVKDVLNVSYTSEISSIRVINMIGQEVISKNINATSTQVDMSQLSAGTYIVNVTVGDNVKTLKVVKQ